MARLPTAIKVGSERPRGAKRLKGAVKVVIDRLRSLIWRPSEGILRRDSLLIGMAEAGDVMVRTAVCQCYLISGRGTTCPLT